MIIAAALVMAIAAQSQPSTGGPPAIRPISADERQAVEGALSEQVTDRAALRFSLPPKMTVSGDYCGFLNGKDASGEYVGYVPFHVRLSPEDDGTITVSEIAISTDAAVSAAIVSACSRAGLDLASGAADGSEDGSR